ncbi:MAG: AAA family ATPase [Aeromicrobium sp.]
MTDDVGPVDTGIADQGDDDRYAHWNAWFEAQELAYMQSLESERRRNALTQELHARAYEECAFLEVEVLGKDKNDHETHVVRRLWDGVARDGNTGAPDPDDDLLKLWVEKQLSKADDEVSNAARRRSIDAMADAAAFEAPDTTTFPRLTDALDADLEPTNYLIDGLLAERENLVLAAGYKAGKSTVAMHLTMCLATGNPFLGCPVKPLEGTVGYWDVELDVNYAVDQFRNMNMPRDATDRIAYRNLKGYPLPLHTEAAFDWAVKDLTEQNCKVLVIDTFGRIFSGDESNNNEVRDFLLRLDLLKRRANVESIILITHTGHVQEGQKPRSRGASYFGDWGGSLWGLERVSSDEASNVRRLQIGTGRGVEPQTLHFSWTPEDGIQLADAPVSQRQSKNDELSSKAWEFVRRTPRSSITAVLKGLNLTPGKRNTVATILTKFVTDGTMTMEWAGSAKLFSVLEIFNEFD